MLAVVSGWVPSEFMAGGTYGREGVLFGEDQFDPFAEHAAESEIRRLQLLPDSLIYHPYLAGPKESRTGLQLYWHDGSVWSWSSSVGGQFGLLRYGTLDEFRPVGIQLDVEGAVHFRSADADALDITSTDIRFGFPVTIGWGSQETKLALYFLRADPSVSLVEALTDETDQVFQRRSIVLGHSVRFWENFRIYGEAGYAFQSDMSGEWEFQFGAEYAPVMPTRIWGAPFAAANVYLLETDSFGGNVTLEAGWCSRGKKRATACAAESSIPTA